MPKIKVNYQQNFPIIPEILVSQGEKSVEDLINFDPDLFLPNKLVGEENKATAAMMVSQRLFLHPDAALYMVEYYNEKILANLN